MNSKVDYLKIFEADVLEEKYLQERRKKAIGHRTLC